VQGKLPIASAKLRIPCVRDGKKTKRALKDVIVAEVNRARLDVLKPREADKRAPEEAVLRAALAKDKELAGLDVRVVAGDGAVRTDSARVGGAPRAGAGEGRRRDVSGVALAYIGQAGPSWLLQKGSLRAASSTADQSSKNLARTHG
jgi:hypothetical protein